MGTTTINRPKRNPKSSDSFPRRKQQQQSHTRSHKNKPINNLQDDTILARIKAKDLVMGQVKILKRGQDLIKNDNDNQDEFILSSTDRLGPEPETLLKQIKQIRVSESDEKLEKKVYAGHSVLSPPPSSVPYPRFIGDHHVKIQFDLRHLLGLNSLL